jgi:prepilin-type N-terminal cleavage/methylation domain-containing protein
MKIFKTIKICQNAMIESKNFRLRGQKGFSLLEMLLAMTISSILLLAAFNIFQSSIQVQQGLTSSRKIDENLKFIVEVISKEIRSAKNFDPAICVASVSEKNRVYSTNDEKKELFFVNKNGECVIYKLNNSKLSISRKKEGESAVILNVTPDEIKISDLSFFVYDDAYGVLKTKQPQITVNFFAEVSAGKYLHKTTIQTTVSSRYYGN